MDHLDEGTLRRIDLRHNRFAGPDSCLNHLRRLGVPEENLLRLPRGGRLAVGDIELFGVHAEHTEDSIGLIGARSRSNGVFHRRPHSGAIC